MHCRILCRVSDPHHSHADPDPDPLFDSDPNPDPDIASPNNLDPDPQPCNITNFSGSVNVQKSDVLRQCVITYICSDFGACVHTLYKRVGRFPVPSRDVTDQTLPGRE